jgi:DNA polymerase-3 subunit delta
VQIKSEQLGSRLRGALAPVYFISGDEPLRVMEAADAVREQARKQGYDEREVLSVQPGFDWGALEASVGSLSLFSQRRVIDLRLPGGKPGDAGARALRAYAEQPPEETILLITAGKLEPSARRSKWVQALDRAGVVVFVWAGLCTGDRQAAPVAGRGAGRCGRNQRHSGRQRALRCVHPG